MYTITKTLDSAKTEQEEILSQIVELDVPHNCIDFAGEGFVETDKFMFQSGWVLLPTGQKIECTRLVMTCDKEHDHGVYYQAPRQMELWEVMFAIGELPADTVPLSEEDKGK